MKIAHLLPHWGNFNYRDPIGIYKVAYDLSIEQIKRGHEVTIIATQKSTIDKAQLIKTTNSLSDLHISLYDDKAFIYGIPHAEMAASISNKFDIIHSHAEQVFLPFIPLIKTPVLSTIHGVNFSESVVYLFKQFYGRFHAVSLSKNASSHNEFIKFTTHVYNGIATDEYGGNTSYVDKYMLWIGRLSPVKGLSDAIKVSEQTQRPLKIAGIPDKLHKNYIMSVLPEERKMKTIEFLGELADQPKKKAYQNAKLLLFPIHWEEPFGLVLVEAMSSGTPVIAFAQGSVPEIVSDGKTGFIINASEKDIRGDWIVKKTGIEGLCEAVERIYSMPEEEYRQMRRNCREHVEKHFTVERMVDDYEKVYQQILAKK